MGKQGVEGLFGLAAQLRVVSWRELGVLEGKVKKFRGKGELCSEGVGSVRGKSEKKKI